MKKYMSNYYPNPSDNSEAARIEALGNEWRARRREQDAAELAAARSQARNLDDYNRAAVVVAEALGRHAEATPAEMEQDGEAPRITPGVETEPPLVSSTVAPAPESEEKSLPPRQYSGEAQLMAAILDWQRSLRKELEADNLATERPPAGRDSNYMAKPIVAQAVELQAEPSPKEDEQAETAPSLEAEPLLASSMAAPVPELEEAALPSASPPAHQLPAPTLPLPPGVKRGLPTHTSQDFRHLPRHVWLVRDVFHGGEVIILWGESQAGKTALLLDMVAAIASGEDWAGHPVTRTNVIYVALEGQIGVRTRVQALEHDRCIGHLEGVHYVFNPCNVSSEEDVNELALTALNHDAKFIVIDTLSASIAGVAEENSNTAMAGVIANVQRLTQMTGAAVLLVHHCGNDPKRGARGAYALHANPDVSIEVGRSGENRHWRLAKGRDGEPAGGRFKIEGISFQPEHETEPLKSIVVRHVEDAEAPAALPLPKTKGQERADEALKAITLHLHMAGIGAEDEQSSGEATHEAISKIVAQAFKEKCDSGEEGYGSNHRAKNVREAIQSLIDAGLLILHEGKVRLPH